MDGCVDGEIAGKGREKELEQQIKIMVVEDDCTLEKEIRDFLQKWGYDTIGVIDYQKVMDEFIKEVPQLILMDINLPYFDGFYWCDQIRRISHVPIVFISSRDDDRDKIMAIAQGADDFVEKPFRLELLRAKIEALLRRTYQYSVSKTSYEEVDLTKSERRILNKLVEQKGRIVTRDELMMELWDTDEYVMDGTLTTLVSRLRAKLKHAYGDEMITTKKGQGYMMP